MDPKAITDLVNAIQALGTTGLLALVIIGGLRRLWVFGWIYEQRIAEVQADGAEWKRLFLDSMDLAKKGSKIAQVAIDKNVG